MQDNSIFHELFVLELANNHWGSLQRGLKIIQDYGCHILSIHCPVDVIFLQTPLAVYIHKDSFRFCVFLQNLTFDDLVLENGGFLRNSYSSKRTSSCTSQWIGWWTSRFAASGSRKSSRFSKGTYRRCPKGVEVSFRNCDRKNQYVRVWKRNVFIVFIFCLRENLTMVI